MTDMLRELASIPVVDLVLMIGLGATSGWLMKNVTWSAESPHTSQKPQNPARLHDFGFFVILGLAGYLSIGAIAAISVLQNPTTVTENVSATKLKEDLEFERQNSEISINDSPPKDSPFSDLKKALENESDQGIRNVESAVIDWNTTRDATLTKYEKHVTGLMKKRDDNLSLAVTNYQVENMDRKGGREAGRYYLDLKNWYSDSLETMKQEIAIYTNNLKSLETFWKDLASRMLEVLHEQNGETAQSRTERISKDLNSQIGSSYNNLSAILPEIEPRPHVDESLPQRKTLGSDLGIFSLLASWILRTESMPLALIVGMVGFGLLGSASSTFIREHANRKSSQPLVSNLIGVVIRGVTAAILFFLAVEGGLLIFSPPFLR
jgi:hypothetical protein